MYVYTDKKIRVVGVRTYSVYKKSSQAHIKIWSAKIPAIGGPMIDELAYRVIIPMASMLCSSPTIATVITDMRVVNPIATPYAAI